MRHTLQQKTINNGDRQTGKVIGGMYFFGNTEETDLNDGLDYVNVGNENINCLTYSSIIPSIGGIPADYFTVNGNTTQTQYLYYTKGKRSSRMNLTYALTIIADDGRIGDNTFRLSLSARIRKQNSNGDFSIIDSTILPITGGPNGIRGGLTVPVDINPGDRFYLQLKNVDLTNPTFDVVVTQAEMVIAE